MGPTLTCCTPHLPLQLSVSFANKAMNCFRCSCSSFHPLFRTWWPSTWSLDTQNNLQIPRSILVGLLHVIHITLCTLTMWLYLHCPLLHNWHSSKVWKIKSTSIRSDESNWPGRLEGREMNGHIHALPLADKYEIAETRLQYKGELFFHFQQNWSAQNKN